MVLEGRRLSLWAGVPVYSKAERREGFRKKHKKQERETPREKQKEMWAKECISDQLFSCLRRLYKATEL